ADPAGVRDGLARGRPAAGVVVRPLAGDAPLLEQVLDAGEDEVDAHLELAVEVLGRLGLGRGQVGEALGVDVLVAGRPPALALDAHLLGHDAQREPREHAEHPVGGLEVQPERAELGQGRLDEGGDALDVERAAGDEPDDGGGGEQHPAVGGDVAAEAGLPAAGAAGHDERHLLEDLLDDALDQVVLAVHVAVERHGLDAELAPEPPHRERLDALGVDQRERSLQDAFTGQRRAPRHGRHLSTCHPAATTLRRRATPLRRRSGVAGEPGAGATVGSVHRQVAESRGGSAMAPEPQSTAIEELLVEDRTFPPPEHFKADALVTGAEVYDEAEKDWQGFWARQAAELVSWYDEWHTILEWDPPFAKWFVGGTLNVSYNCLDRHVEAGLGDRVAYHWEGEPGDRRTITYAQLLDEVQRF